MTFQDPSNTIKANEIELGKSHTPYQTNKMCVGRIQRPTLLAFGIEAVHESQSGQFITEACVVVHLDSLEVPLFTSLPPSILCLSIYVEMHFSRMLKQ